MKPAQDNRILALSRSRHNSGVSRNEMVLGLEGMWTGNYRKLSASQNPGRNVYANDSSVVAIDDGKIVRLTCGYLLREKSISGNSGTISEILNCYIRQRRE